MFLELQRMIGTCPHCAVGLGEADVPVTALGTAYTPGALALFRSTGHLVALCGTRWLVRCAKDAQNRMYTSDVQPGKAGPAVPVAAATQRQGARRG